MRYVVLLESRAEKELKSLPEEVLKRVDIKLQALSLNPHPRGAAKLKGKESEGWRLRIGDYRLLYQIDDKENVVRIYRIKHRREVYRWPIFAITKENDYHTNPTKQAKVKEYERQIDPMVYQLYDLTPEEIAIVEGLDKK